MTDGGESPSGWDGTWCSKGKLKAVRDTAVFSKGPASLRLEPEGECSGCAFYNLEACAGKTLIVKGFLKNSKENRKCVVALASFGANGKVMKWDNLYVPPDSSDTDWKCFEKEVAVPEGAGKVNIQILVEGGGKIWLDEVSCIEKINSK